MILIADAGGSKTDWRIIDGDKITQLVSDGFNFKTHPIDPFFANLPIEILELKNVNELHFYAAGLVSDADKDVLSARFKILFTAADISCYPDTIAAARALFGRSKGYVGLIGTGSGAAYYDGVTLQRIPSLGYLIGDEGSGYQLGKMILTAKVRGQLPKDLDNLFDKTFKDFSEANLLSRVYSKPSPNQLVASYAQFVLENQANPFAYQLIEKVMTAYFEAYFPDKKTNQEHTFRFCGSVAYLSSNILRKVAQQFNASADLIIQSPIAGLTLYHKKS
ncbi:MAG: glucosamine kinase [Marinoscillum sp.]|jgi:glucosamine kinase